MIIRDNSLDKMAVHSIALIQLFFGGKMDLTKGNIKEIYWKYLIASFGGAILPSVYGLVDMIAVGQYHGPIGSATMAIIMPIWNVIFGFGLLVGIGASILFNVQRNLEKSDETKANGYFTVGVILAISIAVILWLGIILFDNEILKLLGADEEIIPLAKEYLYPVKFTIPFYLLMQFLSAFLRNDGNPTLATKAVLTGGVFNIFGDFFFVFVLDMGIKGAGLATSIGAVLSFSIMLLHFRSEKNTLKIVRPKKIWKKSRQIASGGFATFFVDFAVGILTLLFNIQIMKYIGSDALAVFGVIVNTSIFVQCCAYGIGQASQPILSANFGANESGRIKTLLRLNVITVIVISLLWTLIAMLLPNQIVRAFMTPTEQVLQIAPAIIRVYCISYLLLPFNIYATYYFQSIMKPQIAFVISVMRGVVISGALIMILPIMFEGDSMWVAMPITEVLIFIYILLMFRKKE